VANATDTLAEELEVARKARFSAEEVLVGVAQSWISAQAALKVASDEFDRLERALAILNGDPVPEPSTSPQEQLNPVTEPVRAEAPAQAPRPDGPKCNACGAIDTIAIVPMGKMGKQLPVCMGCNSVQIG
jgi:hypothetical protein